MNNIPMRTVRLYGKLRKFGKEYKLAVSSPAEAVKALCVMVPGFEEFLKKSKDKGLVYAVFNGKENINQEQLNFSGTKEIRIAPIPVGSKRGGLFQTILGAALIAFAWWNPLGWQAGGALLTGTFATGISMVAGGVMQMLAPQPKGNKMKEDSENMASYAFSGAVNTTAMGNPVPILAGERLIGGAVISASIYSEDMV